MNDRRRTESFPFGPSGDPPRDVFLTPQYLLERNRFLEEETRKLKALVESLRDELLQARIEIRRRATDTNVARSTSRDAAETPRAVREEVSSVGLHANGLLEERPFERSSGRSSVARTSAVPESQEQLIAPKPLPAYTKDTTVGYSDPRQGIDFGAVARLSADQIDGLPYGLITLDALGRVVAYNDTESRLVGIPKEDVIGKNFFQEVAPCTRLREFEGRFRELVADPEQLGVQSFDFVFRFPNALQKVSVLIVPARRRGHYNMALVRRRE
jgi:photoactive yellow protein